MISSNCAGFMTLWTAQCSTRTAGPTYIPYANLSPNSTTRTMMKKNRAARKSAIATAGLTKFAMRFWRGCSHSIRSDIKRKIWLDFMIGRKARAVPAAPNQATRKSLLTTKENWSYDVGDRKSVVEGKSGDLGGRR